MYKLNKKNKALAFFLVVLFVSVSFELLIPDELGIIPLPPPESVFEIHEYNYTGLLKQIFRDKMNISGEEFYFQPTQIYNSNNTSSRFGIMNSNKDEPLMEPNPTITGLTIKDEKNMNITLEELKEMTPAVVNFYSVNYNSHRGTPSKISAIKVEQVIPKDIPDSLYNYKSGLSPYERYTKALPK
ncbi:hypothetical protein JXI42_07920 [bacterium]|nr:hypothetical protein [bacterium]